MIRSLVRSVALSAVAAVSLVAQAAKTVRYELVADVALAASQGNQDVNTLSLSQRYSYVFPAWKLTQSVSALRGTANGVRNAELYQAALRGDRTVTKKLTAYLALAALRNTPAGLNRQFSEGVGFGYDFVTTDVDMLKLSAGFGALQRSFVGAGGQQDDFVGNLDAMYRHQFSKASNFEQNAAVTPNFSNGDAWMFTSKSSLVAPLSQRIGIKVSYLINFNNSPPLKPASAERFGKFDGLLTTGVQFRY